MANNENTVQIQVEVLRAQLDKLIADINSLKNQKISVKVDTAGAAALEQLSDAVQQMRTGLQELDAQLGQNAAAFLAWAILHRRRCRRFCSIFRRSIRLLRQKCRRWLSAGKQRLRRKNRLLRRGPLRRRFHRWQMRRDRNRTLTHSFLRG